MRNLTRSVTVGIKLEILNAIPPIMEIECADPLLCLVGEGGKLFINPSSWLALRAGCSTQVSPAAVDCDDLCGQGGSVCSGLRYQWSLLEFPAVTLEPPLGLGCSTATGELVCSQDTAIEREFFQVWKMLFTISSPP